MSYYTPSKATTKHLDAVSARALRIVAKMPEGGMSWSYLSMVAIDLANKRGRISDYTGRDDYQSYQKESQTWNNLPKDFRTWLFNLHLRYGKINVPASWEENVRAVLETGAGVLTDNLLCTRVDNQLDLALAS